MINNCKILEGKRGLILGALDEQSLAWHVAVKCLDAGAQIFLSNTETALELGTVKQLASQRKIAILPCDLTEETQICSLLESAQQQMGGKIDFILHSVAQSMNLRRHRNYDDVNYEYFVKTIDISALSLHKLLQTALKMDAIVEGGSVVTLTFLASERYFDKYNDMADAKAMLESIVRQMGAIYGEKHGVRVNAICQSATPTKAGSQWNDRDYFYQYSDCMSPLGNATADDCADVCVALFSDLMKKVTMQTIYNDGGFGRTMLTNRIMNAFRK